jgi:diguanylate cyclase (GGDEF)-like protein/PAS domain S-box-containing protein
MDIGPTFDRLAREPLIERHLADAGFFLMNFADRLVHPSSLMQQLGYTVFDDFEGGLAGQIHAEDDAVFRAQWERLVSGAQNTLQAEFRVRDRSSGEWCWVLSRGTVMCRDQGRMAVYAGVDIDVTARKTSETMVREQLYEAESVFHQAESLRVASLLANSTQDVGKTIDLVLGQAQGLLRFHAATVSAYREEAFHEMGVQGEPDSAETAHPRTPEHPVWAVLAGRTPVLRNDLLRLKLPRTAAPKRQFRSWLGIPLIFRQEFLGVVEFWHRDPQFFRSDQIWPAMGFADSIAESIHNSRTLETLRADTHTDALTGLLTRKYLQETGPQLVERCLKANQPIAVLFLDIDFFKDINDRHGHLVGDAVLMTVAQLCRNVLRKDDLFFRYGGEEFVALLPSADMALAQKIAERLRETAAEARFRGLDRGVTMSIGVAPVIPGYTMPFELLLQEADAAMYRAKEGGRDRVTTSDRWAQ